MNFRISIGRFAKISGIVKDEATVDGSALVGALVSAYITIVYLWVAIPYRMGWCQRNVEQQEEYREYVEFLARWEGENEGGRPCSLGR